MEGGAIIIKIEQRFGKTIEGDPDFVKPIGQAFVNVAEITTSRGGVRSDELIIRAADLLVESEVRSAAGAAALGILVEDAGEKQGIIADVGPKQERLFRIGA